MITAKQFLSGEPFVVKDSICHAEGGRIFTEGTPFGEIIQVMSDGVAVMLNGDYTDMTGVTMTRNEVVFFRFSQFKEYKLPKELLNE